MMITTRAVARNLIFLFLFSIGSPSCGKGTREVVAQQKSSEASAKPLEPIAIEEISLFRDDEGELAGEEVASFRPEDRVFHVVVYFNRINSGLKAKGELIAVATKEGENIPVVSVEEEFGINNQVDLPSHSPDHGRLAVIG